MRRFSRIGATALLVGAITGCGGGSGTAEVAGSVDGTEVALSEAVFGYDHGYDGVPLGFRILLVNDLDGRCIVDTEASPERLTISAKWEPEGSFALINEADPCGETATGDPIYCPTSESTVYWAHFGTRRIGCIPGVVGGWCTSTNATEGTMAIETPLTGIDPDLPESMLGSLRYRFDTGEWFEGGFEARHCASLDHGSPEGEGD